MKRRDLILASCAVAATVALIASAMDANGITTSGSQAGPHTRVQTLAKAGWADARAEIRIKLPARHHGDCWVVRVERSKRDPEVIDMTDGWSCGTSSRLSGARPTVDPDVGLD